MSELISQGGKKTTSSSSSSSYSYSSSSSSSSSSKVTKQSASSTKSSSSSTSSSSMSSSSSKSVSIKSSGQSYTDRMASDFGIDSGDKLKLKMNEEMANIHQGIFQLMPISSPEAEKTVHLLDSNSLKDCIDKAHGDRLKLNFDVNEFESESINIKTVGNKIEVHAKKKSVKGDEERSEEFSRVYELPTSNAIDVGNVSSSIYKDGVLTVELPVADAIAGSDVSMSQLESAMKSASSALTSSSSSTSSSSTTTSKTVGIRSSGQSYIDRISSDFGIDMDKEVDKLKLKMSEEMSNIHQDIFQLIPVSSPDITKTLVRLDSDALKSCIDKATGDRLKLNFDVNEFESESINIKTVGNKIEVHAKKKSIKGDEEKNEEFSRVYELPTSHALDAGNVTSSIYKDGVLTVELPIEQAIAGSDLSLSQLGSAVKSSSSALTSSSTFSSSSSTTSKTVGIKSMGQSYMDRISSDFGIDMGQEMEKLKLKMSEEMGNIHQDIFQLIPASSPDITKTLVRLDSGALKSCIDKAHGDRLKLNFDVNEFESESINIKTDGNKIEVHAKKKSIKGDEEKNEEFSRVYELPTSHALDAGNVTSSLFKDGVLTIELPIDQAIAGSDVSLNP